MNLAERQRPDQEGCGLRSRIAAGAHDERHEKRQDDRFFKFALKELHCARGQHLTQEKSRKPAGPLLNHLAETRAQIWFAQCRHAAEALNVLGARLNDGVDHVVHGDNSKDIPRSADHRHCKQVVL